MAVSISSLGGVSCRSYLPLHTPLFRFRIRIRKVILLCCYAFSSLSQSPDSAALSYIIQLRLTLIALGQTLRQTHSPPNVHINYSSLRTPFTGSFHSPTTFSVHNWLLLVFRQGYFLLFLLFQFYLLVKNPLIMILSCPTGRGFLPTSLGLVISWFPDLPEKFLTGSRKKVTIRSLLRVFIPRLKVSSSISLLILWLLLHALGYEVYLVGGCVRDLILNRTPKDFDIITSAELKEVRLNLSLP